MKFRPNFNVLSRNRRDERGVKMVEYGMIAGLILIVF